MVRAWVVAFGLGLFALIGCAAESSGVASEPGRIYSAESLGALGWKSKGGFQADFSPATSADWGFLDGREVAVIVYGSQAEAEESGARAGAAQIALTEEGSFAPGVERTKCAGFGNYRTPYLVSPVGDAQMCRIESSAGGLGGSERCAMARVASYATEGMAGGAKFDPQTFCPRRVPMYAEYAVVGNLVILCEAKPSDGKAECTALAEKLKDS